MRGLDVHPHAVDAVRYLEEVMLCDVDDLVTRDKLEGGEKRNPYGSQH